ncbi:MAG: ATP-binding cassette domain-containing protein [Chlorobi bacterium]|nr:MAG: ABC transporter-like protein [Chlorobi bacterium OLB7]MBK8911563.1 ATP-binding cassette domain-containing protein [Chlorobiota bacterium]MBX7215741.1 ATP-binding cassette domain-containing protein [Candidatus Kapabacteria bacterium]
MIELVNCSKTFGAGTPNLVRALDALDLAIPHQQFLVVIGANGSGKSTLLNAIAGTFAPDSGSIRINGIAVEQQPAHQRAQFIGRVFQNPFAGTAPTMTVAENLRLAALRGLPKRPLVGLNRAFRNQLRDRVAALGMQLEDRMETPIGLLSGGQRQALTLLMATFRPPSILLLDEHTAALDPASAEKVMELTARIVSEGSLTTLMVTHDMDHATRVGQRLVMMEWGRIALDIAGAEKATTTPTMLLEQFARRK